MAQWGQSRAFDSADATVTLLPHVETEEVLHTPDTPVVGKIDSLYMVNRRGLHSEADRLLAEARAKYVGRPYSEWEAGR